MSRYLSKNTKTGDFNLQRTLSRLFFVIPKRLASMRAVVLAFTANKQTLSIIYIDTNMKPYKNLFLKKKTKMAQARAKIDLLLSSSFSTRSGLKDVKKT